MLIALLLPLHPRAIMSDPRTPYYASIHDTQLNAYLKLYSYIYHSQPDIATLFPFGGQPSNASQPQV